MEKFSVQTSMTVQWLGLRAFTRRARVQSLFREPCFKLETWRSFIVVIQRGHDHLMDILLMGWW